MTDEQWYDIITHLSLPDLDRLEKIVSALEAGFPVTSVVLAASDESS